VENVEAQFEVHVVSAEAQPCRQAVYDVQLESPSHALYELAHVPVSACVVQVVHEVVVPPVHCPLLHVWVESQTVVHEPQWYWSVVRS
jgi:hypothetical protein